MSTRSFSKFQDIPYDCAETARPESLFAPSGPKWLCNFAYIHVLFHVKLLLSFIGQKLPFFFMTIIKFMTRRNLNYDDEHLSM